MIHTVLFDAGGTIVTGKTALELLADILDPENETDVFDLMRKKFLSLYLDDHPIRFYTIKEMLTLCVKEASQQLGLEDISADVPEHYRMNYLERGVLYDDTIPVLTQLKERNVKMVLVSDADADVLTAQLSSYGVMTFFDATVISSDVRAYKPSDATVAEVRKHCREPFSEILFVGDTIVDIRTAEKLGVKSALINRERKFTIAADYHLPNLLDIISIMDNTAQNRKPRE